MNKKTIIILIAVVVFIIGFFWLKKAAPPTEPAVIESPLNNDLPDPTVPAPATPESSHK